jgi:cation-transporting ATPase E
LLAVILVVAPIQDALFGIVLVANALIGIIQELRAKRTLDRLALLSAPHAMVIREGRRYEIPVDQVVLDDLLSAGPGDQIVVDGLVVISDSFEVNESLLTGEADPIPKNHADEVLSGSFVSSGSVCTRRGGWGPTPTPPTSPPKPVVSRWSTRSCEEASTGSSP